MAVRDGAMAANYLIREARIAGISEKTLRRAKFKLGVISKVWPYGRSSGQRWGWQLPRGVDDEAQKNGLDRDGFGSRDG